MNIERQFYGNGQQIRVQQKLDYPVHVHDDIELIYVKKGSGVCFCNGIKYTVDDGDFFFVFPNCVHSYEKSVSGNYRVIIVKPSELLQYESVFYECIPETPVIHCTDERIPALIEALYDERKGDSDIIFGYLTLIFGKLLKLCSLVNADAASDKITEVLEYCIKNRNDDISVSSVAKATKISESYVSYIFGKKLSVKFCNYINSLRINDAEKLLKNEKYSITEIAGLTGFNTLRTFNRAFLRETGMTPTQYRKNRK